MIEVKPRGPVMEAMQVPELRDNEGVVAVRDWLRADVTKDWPSSQIIFIDQFGVEITVYPGEWIVLDDQHRATVCPKNVMWEQFERVESDG